MRRGRSEEKLWWICGCGDVAWYGCNTENDILRNNWEAHVVIIEPQFCLSMVLSKIFLNLIFILYNSCVHYEIGIKYK